MTQTAPEFEIGQGVAVILNERNKTARNGHILWRAWHYKESRYCYGLIENGKRVKKYYWAEDLIPTGA